MCAQLFPSFQQNLKYLETGSYDDEQKPAANGVVTLSEPASQSDYSVRDTGDNKFNLSTTDTGSVATPTIKSPNLVGKTGSIFSRLFDPLSKTLESSQSSLKDITDIFGTKAGASRTYEGIGGQSTLEKALKPVAQGAPEYNDWLSSKEAAKSLAGTSYTGPTELSDVSQINSNLASIQDYTPLLKSQAGVKTLLKQSLPGLTPGEYAAEAARVYTSPEFVQRSSQLLPSVEKFSNLFKTQSDAAKSYAAQRQAEEADIATKANEYLTGQKTSATTAVQSELDKRLANQAAQELAYYNLMNDNTAPDTSLIKNAELLNSTESQTAKKADQVWNEVIGKFDDLKDIPLMELYIDGQGREGLNMSAEWMKEHPEYKRDTNNKLYNRLLERNQALETAGFAPSTTRNPEAGIYSTYKPLYGGYDPDLSDAVKPSYSPYSMQQLLSFEQGNMPTFENTSTDDQRNIINTVNELLGDVDRLEAAGESYKAAQIAVNLEQILNQTAEVQEREKTLGNWSKDTIAAINKARKQYKKSKGGGFFGKVVNAIGDMPGGDIALTVSEPLFRGVNALGSMVPGAVSDIVDKTTGTKLGLDQMNMNYALTDAPGAKPYTAMNEKLPEISNQSQLDAEKALTDGTALQARLDSLDSSGMLIKIIQDKAAKEGITLDEAVRRLMVG